MGNALQLQIVTRSGHIVQQQNSALPAGEELLQSQDLAAVSKRIARQQLYLRERIKDHPIRLQPLHLLANFLYGFVSSTSSGRKTVYSSSGVKRASMDSSS